MAKEAVVLRGAMVELEPSVPVSFRNARLLESGSISPGSGLGPGVPSKERSWEMISAFSVVLATSLVCSFWVSWSFRRRSVIDFWVGASGACVKLRP